MINSQRESYDEDFLVDIDSDFDPGFCDVNVARPALPAWISCSGSQREGKPQTTSGPVGGLAFNSPSLAAAPLSPRSRGFQGSCRGHKAASDPSPPRLSTPEFQPSASHFSSENQAGLAVGPSHTAQTLVAVESLHAADFAVHGQAVDMTAIDMLAADKAGPSPVPAAAEPFQADAAAFVAPGPLTVRAADLITAGAANTEAAAEHNDKGIESGICKPFTFGCCHNAEVCWEGKAAP